MEFWLFFIHTTTKWEAFILLQSIFFFLIVYSCLFSWCLCIVEKVNLSYYYSSIFLGFSFVVVVYVFFLKSSKTNAILIIYLFFMESLDKYLSRFFLQLSKRTIFMIFYGFLSNFSRACFFVILQWKAYLFKPIL